MLAANFGDSEPESAVGFESCWRADITTADSEAQTDALEVKDYKSQHPKLKEAEMQSEAVEVIGAVPMRRSGFEKLKELDAFLEQCTPLLEEQLKRNLTTRAFDGHEVSWEEQHDQVTCLHSLKTKGKMAKLAPDSCTCVVWNAPGTVVAAAYGALDRNDWPHSASMLCTWSIFRRTLDPSKADHCIELPECLTCLAFHPEDPALLAGGSYNGDVMLWRLADKGDPLVGKSVLTNFTHHEPVQSLKWTRDPHGGARAASYVLASVSADGKMLLWSPSNGIAAPVGGFHLTKPDGRASATGSGERGSSLIEGGAALSFNAEDPTTFVVGLEAGVLYKGSLLANELRSVAAIQREHAEVAWSSSAAALITRVPGALYLRLKTKCEKEALLDKEREVLPRHVYSAGPDPKALFASPIQFAYTSHAGPVYEAAFSPFHRNVFLSASTDASLRLYNQLQPAPFHTTEPSASTIFSAAWSPARPLVFAVGAGDGSLYIYDLKRSKGKPEVTLKVTDKGAAVTGVAFNPRSPELLATADADGFVKIWRLSTFLSQVTARELEVLRRMASRGIGGAAEQQAGAAEDADEPEGYEEGFEDEDD